MAVNYPDRIESGNPAISCVLHGEVYQVTFPYDPKIVERAKQALAAPRWNRDARAWEVKRRNHKRLPEDLKQISALYSKRYGCLDTVLKENEEVFEQARKEQWLSQYHRGDGWFFKDPTGQDAEVVDLARKAGFTQDRTYRHLWEAYNADIKALAFLDLARQLSLTVAKAKAEQEARALEQRQAAEERRAREERERPAREAEYARQRAEKEARRRLMRVEDARLGKVIDHRDTKMVIESVGKVFEIDEDGQSFHCSTLWWRPVRYAYLRPATEDEIEQASREADAKAERQQVLAAARAVREELYAAAAAPEIGHVPEGELLWEDRSSSPYGYHESIVLSEGWLYIAIYDGGDGAAWGTYNLGPNTRGRRLEATDARVEALRAAGKDWR